MSWKCRTCEAEFTNVVEAIQHERREPGHVCEPPTHQILCTICGRPVRQRSGRPPPKCCSMACRRLREERESVVKICQVCGKPFRLAPAQNTPDRKHCSKACCDKAQRDRPVARGTTRLASCKTCGKPFRSRKAKGYWSKWCSFDCYESQRHPKQTKPCEVCGVMFSAKFRARDNGYQKYCGPSCAIEASRSGLLTICCVCGSPIYRSPAKVAKSATGWYYCSRECRNDGMIQDKCGLSWKSGTSVTENGYIEIALLHAERIPRTDKHGGSRQPYRPMHRLIVEAVLGRALSPDEPVWHLDRDLTNNDPFNLFLFATMADMWRAIARQDYPERCNLPADGCSVVSSAMAEARGKWTLPTVLKAESEREGR